MKNLKEKMKKQGGFTLIEMLIVVAIIAILVAVSIPLVGSALERTKHATDAANERAAKAEILLCYLADVDAAKKVAQDEVWYYNATAGTIVKTFADAGTGYGKHGDHDGLYIAIRINTSNEVEMQWTKEAVTTFAAGTDLCSAADKVDHF